METLRKDATRFFDPTWNTDFYDSIAQYVPNYVPSSGRTTWKGHVDLPEGARRPIAVLAQNEVDFQDNVLDTKAYRKLPMRSHDNLRPTNRLTKLHRILGRD